MKKEPIAIIGTIITIAGAVAPHLAELGVPPEIASVVIGLIGTLGTVFGRSRVSPVK